MYLDMCLSTPQFSIVLVSFESKQLVQRCLRHLSSLSDVNHAEIIVVDNASSDGTAELVAEFFPNVRLFSLPQNIGFGGANNVGLALSLAEFQVLLNTDAFPIEGSLSRIVEFLRANRDVGFVGASLKYPDLTDQPSWFGVPSCTSVAAMALGDRFRWIGTILDKMTRRSVINQVSFPQSSRQDDSFVELNDTAWLMGAALGISGRMVAETDGFDPSFFMYYEETEWQLRAVRQGWRHVLLKTSQVVHEEGGSQGGESVQRICRRLNGLFRFMRKEHGWLCAVLLASMMRSGALLRGFVLVLTGFGRGSDYSCRGYRQLGVAFSRWSRTTPKSWREGKKGKWISQLTEFPGSPENAKQPF